MEEEKQRETNGQRRKETYGKQKRNQSHLIWFNLFAAGISKCQESWLKHQKGGILVLRPVCTYRHYTGSMENSNIGV